MSLKTLKVHSLLKVGLLCSTNCVNSQEADTLLRGLWTISRYSCEQFLTERRPRRTFRVHSRGSKYQLHDKTSSVGLRNRPSKAQGGRGGERGSEGGREEGGGASCHVTLGGYQTHAHSALTLFY